jgi:hypothetical protein
MRLLGSIFVALGLGAAVILTDVVVENGSGQTSSFSVFGDPMGLPRWVLFTGLPMLGALMVTAGWAGVRALRSGRERRRKEGIRDEVAAAEARLAELGSMRRVMEELNFELSVDHEKLQAKKLVLAAEVNGDLVIEAKKRRPSRARISSALTDGAAANVASAPKRSRSNGPGVEANGSTTGSSAPRRSRDRTVMLPDLDATGMPDPGA